MANLEKIMAETSKSYDNSRKALNDQIGAISSDLAAQQQRINAQYAQQGKNLDNQRNWQAQASSMSASRNGGSFGGSAGGLGGSGGDHICVWNHDAVHEL